MFQITPNDGAKIPVILLDDNQPFNIPVDTIIKAAVVSKDHTKKLMDDIAQVSTTVGADWANSSIVILFTPADLVGIVKNQAIEVEIQMTKLGDQPVTYWYERELTIGLISS